MPNIPLLIGGSSSFQLLPFVQLLLPPPPSQTLPARAWRGRAIPQAAVSASAARTCRRRGRSGLHVIMLEGTLLRADTRRRAHPVEEKSAHARRRRRAPRTHASAAMTPSVAGSGTAVARFAQSSGVTALPAALKPKLAAKRLKSWSVTAPS